MIFNSGWRCQKHNIEVGGEPNSAHLYGLAADIRAETSRMRFDILINAFSVGISRIGFGRNFIHLDIGNVKNPNEYPANVVWDYYPKAKT